MGMVRAWKWHQLDWGKQGVRGQMPTEYQALNLIYTTWLGIIDPVYR